MKHFPWKTRQAVRLFCAVLTLLMLTGVLPFLPAQRASAATANAFFKRASEVDEETLYAKQAIIDDFSKDKGWEGSKFVKSVGTTEYSGNTRCLLATADTDTRRTLGVSKDFDEFVSLEGYGEVMFSFIALGGKDYSYTLETVLARGEERYVFTVTLQPNEWYDVFLDTVGIESFDSVKITATGKGTSSKISSIALSSFIMGDTSHSDNAKRFCAIDVDGGRITEDGIRVVPDGTHASVSADAVLSTPMGKGVSTVILSVKLSGISHAKMSFSTGSEALWKVKEFTERSLVTVSDMNESYVTCFAVEGRIVSFRLDFEGVVCDEDFVIEEISLVAGRGESIDYPLDVTLGSVSRCSFIGEGEDSTVQIGGKITRDAAVSYIDGEICLYLIPVWATVNQVLEAEPLMRADISTEFNFRVPLSSHPAGRAGQFIVALKSNDDMACITLPISPSPTQSVVWASQASTIICGGESDEVFSSGADGAVLDIPLDRLILSSASNNAVLTAFGDSYVYLDRSILSAISDEMEFYSACGVDVYFRLCVSKTDMFISAAGKSASGYAMDVSTKQNADALCAAVDYLASSYSPDAFLIGYGMNSLNDNCSTLFDDAFAYMKNQSALVRCVYSIAASYDARVRVFVPFESVNEEMLAETSGGLPAYLPAVQCAALCDYYTGAYQNLIRWAAVTKVTPSSSWDITPYQSFLSGSGFLGTSILLGRDVEGNVFSTDEAQEKFGRMLSLFVNAEDANIFANSVEGECTVNPLPYQAEWANGIAALWDFTKSFSTQSWRLSDHSDPTTQISSALTDVMPFSTCRALHFILDGAGSDVIASAKIPAGSVDLSKCSHVELLLTAQGEGEEVSLTVITGGDGKRQLFPVTLRSGECVSVICPIGEGGSFEYFAISGGGEECTVVDVAAVRALSSEHSDSELSPPVTVADSSDGDEAELPTGQLLVPAIVVTALLSIAAFAFLSRKKR